jgi:hypothetical protein
MCIIYIYMKTCSCCKEDKPLDHFFNSKIFKDGKYYICKPCQRISDKKSKTKRSEKIKAYNELNKGKMSVYKKEYKQKNKEKLNEQRRKARKTCPYTKMARAVEKRMHKLKLGTYSVAKLTGCGRRFLKEYIESLWTEGMSWHNYGRQNVSLMESWEIDHIRPCSDFDLTDPEQQKLCFHYSNLQPLWAKDNLSKGAKFEG